MEREKRAAALAAQQEPEPATAVDWPGGERLVTRVTAALRIAPPGPAEDYGGVEWVHRHETRAPAKQCS